jgi:hypothetical protein
MKLIIAAIAVVAAFWCGYGLSTYRNISVFLPEMTRAGNASDASILIRSIDLIDKGDIPTLRAKLFAMTYAKISNPMPSVGFDWRGFLGAPLENMDEATDYTRQHANEQIAAVRTDIKRLCQSPPQTETYKWVCSR